MNRPINAVWIILSCLLVFSQLRAASTPALAGKSTANFSIDTLTPSKKGLIVAAANVGLWTGSYVLLNKAWYQQYDRERFHFFNDNAEWNQMDKCGHVWTTYQVSRLANEWWRWTGMSKNKSAVLGGVFGMAYQGLIEIQDGYSSKWGFSWGDMMANTIGAASFVGQQIGWSDQRIQVKFSYAAHAYSPDLIGRRNQLFGENALGRVLKDYNSQTYWISANLKSFFPNSNFPKWLNISAGYSSDLMLGGRDNLWAGPNGNIKDHTDIPRIRRFYLSADLDLTKIKTKNKVVRGLFFALNMIKIPAPTIEYSRNGFVLHGMYF
jgi:VanZ family protein